MSASSTAAFTVGNALRVRTELLEAVGRYCSSTHETEDENRTHAALGSSSDVDNATPSGRCDGASASLLKAVVQRNPSVTNPSWAMEECGRLCPNAELWCGTALPKAVWAPPGTPDCPFGTQPADYRIPH